MIDATDFAGQARHLIVVVLDNQGNLIGYESRKSDGFASILDPASVKSRFGLPSVTGVGGSNVGTGPRTVDAHPGPQNDPDHNNSVNEAVRSGAGRVRAHMTFAATANDPCWQLGRDLICY